MRPNNTKRLMILGGGQHQLQIIQASKELGYYTIVCDMRDELEGVRIADEHLSINYMQYEEVLAAAKKCKIDGILSNSEPAMLNVARLSQELGLIGNTVESTKKLLSKNDFRILQREAEVYAPAHYAVETVEELLDVSKQMNYPVIVKPMECSGTRGTKKVENYDSQILAEAFTECFEFSRNHKVAIEEFVEMSSLRLNNAEIVVVGEDIIWDGTLWEDRSPDTPMLPMTEIYPMNVSDEDLYIMQETVNKIIKASGVSHGEYNLETYFTKNHEVFVIEINPRQGGNHIPRLVKEHTGVDLSKLLVSTSVGDMSYYEELKHFERENNIITCQNVFAKKDGIYNGLYIDPELQQYVTWIEEKCNLGDAVFEGVNAGDTLAYVTMQFDSIETQHRCLTNIEKLIYARVK